MGLDITVKRVKEHRCPDCGRVVFTEVVDAEESGGRDWYPFLEAVGYYIPYEQRKPEDIDWYGKDMRLTDEQIKMMMVDCVPDTAYNWNIISGLVAATQYYDDCYVVINADW